MDSPLVPGPHSSAINLTLPTSWGIVGYQKKQLSRSRNRTYADEETCPVASFSTSAF